MTKHIDLPEGSYMPSKFALIIGRLIPRSVRLAVIVRFLVSCDPVAEKTWHETTLGEYYDMIEQHG